MQFFPSARFFQYSSRFRAWGNCPAIPITAIRSLPPTDPFPRDPLAAASLLSLLAAASLLSPLLLLMLILLRLLLDRLPPAVLLDLSFRPVPHDSLSFSLLHSFSAIGFCAIGCFSAIALACTPAALTPATFPNFPSFSASSFTYRLSCRSVG